MENNNSEPSPSPTSHTPRKRRKKTKAILLRIPEQWLKVLNLLTLQVSTETKYSVTVQDMIRLVIEKEFMTERLVRRALSKEGIFTQEEILKVCQLGLQQSGHLSVKR
jgi:hypothetical protein